MTEVCNEGPRSNYLSPHKEDHMGLNSMRVVLIIVRLYAEDLRTFQSHYDQNFSHTVTCQPMVIMEGLPYIWFKVGSYALVAGLLIYAMVMIGLDIAHAVGIVNMFMHTPDRALDCNESYL